MNNKQIIKYPIGLQDFEGLISDGYLYVDKTEILFDLISSGRKYVFLSRPRRFGKSLTISTLKAFFEGKKQLFNGLAVEHLEKDWKKHPVFLISFARFEKSQEKSLEDILEYYLKDWEQKYGVSDTHNNHANRFASLIRRAVEHNTIFELSTFLKNGDPDKFLTILKAFFCISSFRNE